MPEGVEHGDVAKFLYDRRAVILPVMPEGVEHEDALAFATDWLAAIPLVIPEGVEHEVHTDGCAAVCTGGVP